MKYQVLLESGRDFIIESTPNIYEASYDAYEEACLHDDYLVDVIPIPDA